MNVENRIQQLERQLATVRGQIQQRQPAGSHPFAQARLAKVVEAATTGATFSIIFLDGHYASSQNSSVASYSNRQATFGAYCQNLNAAGGNPPVNTRILAHWWGGQWWTWWAPSSTSTTSDKSFWLIGPPVWTLDDPTAEQTGTDAVITPAGTSFGNSSLGAVPQTSALYSASSVVASYDDTETDFLLKGPITCLEDGRYEVSINGNFYFVRSTGADADPAAGTLLTFWSRLNETDGSSVTHDLQVGWSTFNQVGDSGYTWEAWLAGYESLNISGLPHAFHFNHRTLHRLYSGRFYLPFAQVTGIQDYGASLYDFGFSIRKLSD